jgi:hypothetical protein
LVFVVLTLLAPPSAPANVVEVVVEILPVIEFNDAVSPETDNPPPAPSVDIDRTDSSAVEAPRVEDSLPDSRTEEIDALSIDTVSDANPAPATDAAAGGTEVC